MSSSALSIHRQALRQRLSTLVCVACVALGAGGTAAVRAQNSLPPPSGGPAEFAPGRAVPMAVARVFEIRGFDLDDQAGLAPERRRQVQAVFNAVRGRERTLGEVTTARLSAQALLDRAQPGELAVNVPEQTLTNGRIRVVVASTRGTRIARVSALGAPGFGEENVRASVPALGAGLELDTFLLDRQLRLGELHPFKRTNVTLGRQSDGTPAAVVTAQAERSTLGLFTADNYGPRDARARLGAGYVDGNLTGRDDVLSLSYVSALQRDRLHGLSVSYALPLYRYGQMLELSAAHSKSDSANTVDLFRINGTGTAASIKWSYMLPRYGGANLRLTAGYLVHRTRSQVTFNANSSADSLLLPGATAPLSVGLEGELRPTGLGLPVVVTGGVNLAHNFAGSFGSTDEARLGAIRRGAGDFTLASARLRADAETGGWQLRGNLLGQTTGNALTAADQLNVVGPYAVRGFRDAGLLGDRALVTSAELATPVLASLAEARLRGWGFVDYATVRRNQAQDGELARGEVASAGLGLRAAARWGTVDVYGARKLAGRVYDADNSRYSLWVNAAFRF